MRSIYALFLAVLGLIGCSTDRISEEIPNNNANPPHRVSTIKVENYVNRLFIDFLGRTPTPDELAAETDSLLDKNLSLEARSTLVTKLQFDSTFRPGDSSYQVTYYQRFYDLVKAKMVEGASDGEFYRPIGLARNRVNLGRLVGDSAMVYQGLLQMARNQDVLDCRVQYRKGTATINQVFARMLNNSVYDVINMNTFNFVNASFDNLFGRYPTQNEFDAAYEIIQNNEVRSLMGGYADNKKTYCVVLTEADEFYEGLIYWAYQSLMGRDPSTSEVNTHFQNLKETRDFQALQETIVVTDEYANF